MLRFSRITNAESGPEANRILAQDRELELHLVPEVTVP
jgi:hypothetical protein